MKRVSELAIIGFIPPKVALISQSVSFVCWLLLHTYKKRHMSRIVRMAKLQVTMVWYRLLPKILQNSFPQPMPDTGVILSLLSAQVCPQYIVGNDRNSDLLSINIPKGMFPSPGVKLTTFSVISGSCNKVFATPDGGLVLCYFSPSIIIFRICNRFTDLLLSVVKGYIRPSMVMK